MLEQRSLRRMSTCRQFISTLRARVPVAHSATALIAIGLVLTACRTRSAQNEVPQVTQDYDRQFLHWLANYHHDGDRMIDPCRINLTIRKELRDFCATVDAQHKERVERMNNWMKQWYNEELSAGEPWPLWLGSLKGAEFEREFLKEYSAHHEEAVKPTTECAQKAVHPELRELCARIAPRQKEDVQQLRKWRCEWFKECD